MVADDKSPRAAEAERLRALHSLTPDFVAVVDLDGVIRYVSPAVSRVMGYAAAEMIGRPLLEFVHPEDRAHGIEDFGRLIVVDEIAPGRLRLLHKDGSLRILEAQARPHDGEHTEQGLSISARDVTPGAEREAALQDALAEVRDLYNNAPCGYHSLDAQGVIVRINDTELNWLGRSREEVVGKLSGRDLLSPASAEKFDREFPRFLASGLVENMELELVRKDGSTFQALLSATAVFDRDGHFVMSRTTVNDISARKQAESALQRTNRTLRVLSAATSQIVHAEAESALLESICRVCVELGGYRMAWVGYALPDDARTVQPVAQSGFDDGYLEHVEISWADNPRGRGPTGTAIRTGTTQVNHDFLSNPDTALWRADAIRRGYQSSIAMPLAAPSGMIGALTLYATEADAFDDDELRLLNALADDLAFGISALRARAAHRRGEERIAHLAFFDGLTGLPNRNRLIEIIRQSTQASDGRSFALLTLDVVRFAEIQAGIGIREADELLCQLARRLQGIVGDSHVIARLGGDEFVVLLRGADHDGARGFARKIETAMGEPFQLAGVPISVQMRIGVSLSPQHGHDPEALLLRSGIASRQSRRIGTRFSIYGGPGESESPHHLALISELRRAIDSEQLILHYQPKIDLVSGRVVGAEALSRWPHPDRGMLLPGAFIPLAEQTGLIEPLTYHVLDHALGQCRRWLDRGFELPVAVNVPVNSFHDPEFQTRFSELLSRWQLPPGLLQLEITESTLMEEAQQVIELLGWLQAQGIQVSIDDFGTGYSSLSYLANLPIHALKIDRSFIAGMLDQPRTRAVIAATVSLARSLGIRSVAEGVETEAQREALAAIGCNQAQGFLFSPAVDAEAFCCYARDHGTLDTPAS